MRSLISARGLCSAAAALVVFGLWCPACSDSDDSGLLDSGAADGDGGGSPEVTFGDPPDGAAADTADAGSADVGGGQDAGATADAGGGQDTGPTKSGFEYECKPLTVESCVTACGSAGHRKCLKEWGGCAPPPEFCGNCADDNCNGLINEGCPPNPKCNPPDQKCPVAIIAITEGKSVGTGTVLHLSASGSYGQGTAKVVKWAWSVQAPLGAAGSFKPSDTVVAPTFLVDAAGSYLFQLDVWDDQGVKSCVSALANVASEPSPPVKASVGCADGQREGFLDQNAYPQIAACAGAWDQPGVTPDAVKPTCGNQGGDDGAKADGKGCASADLCAVGWHVCKGWQEVAQKSPTGCADATPPGAKPKSLFFAIRQPSENGSVCGKWGDGVNDIFGCGNLGTALAPEKKCGPLDRVIASTKPNVCGFNEAEPNLGPWECVGPGASDLEEGANVTKKACQGKSCQYDGVPLGPSDKGGVVCCYGEAPK